MVTFRLDVLLPVVLGCVCMSGMFMLKRFILKGKRFSPIQFCITGFGAATGVFGACYLAFWGFSFPTVLPGFWTAVFAGTAANIVIQFLNAKAASIDQGEVSLTAPLQAMTPGLITFLALTVGEFPGFLGWSGVICIMCGSWVLLLVKKPERWWEYLGPFQRLSLLRRFRSLTPEERGKTVVVMLSLGSAVMGTVGLLFDGLYVRRGLGMQGLFLAAFTLTAILTAFYSAWYLVRPDATAVQRAGFRATIATRVVLLFLLWGLAWVLCISFIQPTFSRTLVAYVGTLKHLRIPLTVLTGFLLFREGDIRKRLVAAILIVIGAILIGLDGAPARLTDRMEAFGF